jgi:hypothetical protein
MAAGQLPYGAVGELVASVYVDSGTWTSEQKWAFGLGQTLAGIALGIEGLAEMGTGGGLTVVTAPAGGVGAIVGAPVAVHGASTFVNGMTAIGCKSSREHPPPRTAG